MGFDGQRKAHSNNKTTVVAIEIRVLLNKMFFFSYIFCDIKINIFIYCRFTKASKKRIKTNFYSATFYFNKHLAGIVKKSLF